VKILHVLQFSLPRLYGYSIRSDATLRAQKAHGLDVVALTGAVEDMGQGPQEDVNGIRYYRTPGVVKETQRGLREWKLYRRLLQRLTAVAEIEQPDVIHVHSPAYNALAALTVARRLRVPCVYEMRAVWEDAAADRQEVGTKSLKYQAARLMETNVLKRCSAVVTICEGLRQEVLSRGISPDKIVVAPNAVEPDSFEPRPRDPFLTAELGLNGGQLLAYIGSLFGYEGVEDLLEAVPAVLQHVPKARFLVVGGGERQDAVRERIAQLSDPRVQYIPRVPHERVRALYSVADCLVYPRRSVRLTELVTPLKPLEAMAMGKPVVATDIGGHREMITHQKTGLLYKAASGAALIDTLCRALGEPALLTKLARAGREYVLDHRNWHATTARYLPLYESLVR
jgi:PEP-CTERM/exosortase A-associated glycosyltransferase